MFLLCFFGKQRDTLQEMFPIIASADMSPDFACSWLAASGGCLHSDLARHGLRHQEPSALKLPRTLVAHHAAAFRFLANIRPGPGISLPPLPSSSAGSILWWTGLLITAMGIAISVWARLSLGANWSGIVTVKAGHELIRRGLYRLIRHPIYTGILLGAIGTGLIQSQLRDLLGFLILYITFYFKAKREESFLQQEFGSSFTEHQQTTGMFWPKFS
jgi:protein-S-isoprenylcysteine O-methyltransferase Ste14